jgi:uncharacterized protein (DUF1501 family)
MSDEKTGPENRAAAAACGCAGWSRSELLRHGAAQAGRGLPAIEPGMPLPAGTGLTRRSFMWRSAGLAMAVYGAAAVGPRMFEEGIADAMAAGPSDAVLVSIFLSGGADSLSVLAPAGHSSYTTLRPTLALPNDPARAFSEDTSLQWHPSALELKTLHEEGKVSVLPAIGYTDPNQSHFTSRHYWEVGETNPAGRVGWLGRYLDQHGTNNNPLQGLALDWTLAPSLATASNPVAAVSDPANYSFDAQGVGDPIELPMLQELGSLGNLATGDSQLAKAREALASTSRLREQLAPFAGSGSGSGYPDDTFSRRLSSLATMIGAGLPLKAVTLEGPGGYDTHADEAQTLTDNLTSLSTGLFAFQRDLETRGIADRVLVQVWSEFGRRPEENGSGTDHGAAGLSLLIGSKAAGTMIGGFPGLTSGVGGGLDSQDNLRATSDFRSVYCSLLEQWLNVDAAPIIPGADSFARYALVA